MLVKISAKNEDFTDSEFERRFLLPLANVDFPDEKIIFLDISISVRIVKELTRNGDTFILLTYIARTIISLLCTSKRKANWNGYILRRNWLIRQVIEGKIKGGIEVTGRRGRRRRKLLDHRKERRGYSHLKEKALDRNMWRARFGRGFGPVVRQTTK
jgi:hypothetical protein